MFSSLCDEMNAEPHTEVDDSLFLRLYVLHRSSWDIEVMASPLILQEPPDTCLKSSLNNVRFCKFPELATLGKGLGQEQMDLMLFGAPTQPSSSIIEGADDHILSLQSFYKLRLRR